MEPWERNLEVLKTMWTASVERGNQRKEKRIIVNGSGTIYGGCQVASIAIETRR